MPLFGTGHKTLDGRTIFLPTIDSMRKGAFPMAIVPSFKHDVFLSYAHVDDKPIPGCSCARGWVTTLVNNLQWQLEQLCGRGDAFKLWTDGELARHVNFSPQILSSLRESAILMVILSPGYLASDWCSRERETFLSEVKKRRDQGSSVFIVERDQVLEERPAEISGLIGYKFWEAPPGRAPRILGHPQPTEAYFDKLNELARDLYKELFRLRRIYIEGLLPHPTEGTVSTEGKTDLDTCIKDPPPPLKNGPVIFLAEVTEDLDELRDQVKRYLDQHGLRVLPEGCWYPRDAQAFQEAADRDLNLCTAFVQLLGPSRGKLLGPSRGKSPPGSSFSYVAMQHQRAIAAGKPILQWRNPRLDPESIEDSVHRALVTGDTVQAVDLETFKREIVKQANEPPPPPPPGPFVFVDIDHEDLPIAENLYEILERHKCAYAIRMQEGKAAAVRKDLEANLLDCDGLIVVYGQIPEVWVRDQLRLWCKMLHRRKKPLRALAVYEGPPDREHPLGMRLPQMQIIDCRNGAHVDRLKPFLRALRAREG